MTYCHRGTPSHVSGVKMKNRKGRGPASAAAARPNSVVVYYFRSFKNKKKDKPAAKSYGNPLANHRRCCFIFVLISHLYQHVTKCWCFSNNGQDRRTDNCGTVWFFLLFLGEKFVQFYFQFVAAIFNSEGEKGRRMKITNNTRVMQCIKIIYK